MRFHDLDPVSVLLLKRGNHGLAVNLFDQLSTFRRVCSLIVVCVLLYRRSVAGSAISAIHVLLE